ncbi:hypothetical protein L202_06664 [Cryptococcus amylolentus CBS 6039]|uniref:Uncharacterized protein n=1 Tax=Cryptococcus amylolentus CBS 6039 TaxID=1295533 RepID=A0A1E3HGS4_9TREE|nr:hypothetical protein L202_06664 [Cryptococcus amylolentus CBS 6039]ODN75539.1 hypothetical protein L202_06664 [Cryptococcus amylolentus CBS 6039]
MSLNNVKLTQDGQPDIAESGETFTTGPHAVEIHLVLPPSFGSSDHSHDNSSSKGKRKGKKRVLKAEKGRVYWVADQQIDWREDQEGSLPMNSLMIPFTNLYSQTYSKVLFAPSTLTLAYLPGHYPAGVALFPPLAPAPPDFGRLIEAVIKSKDKGVLMAIKEGVEVGKEESIRGERIGESLRAVREEGWGVRNGP